MSGAHGMAGAALGDLALRAAYLRLVEERFGLRLSAHQARDLESAVRAVQADAGAPDAAALLRTLAGGGRPDLLEALVARLTVGETHFYRIRPQIDALRQTVLPDVLARRAAERRLRLWSAGCSSGEEAYTLAMLVREALPEGSGWDVRLVGTDVSRPALEAARRAVYGEWSFRDTPLTVRRRYFTTEGQHWRLAASVRQMVRFAHLNLVADDATWRGVLDADLDLILCRNVTIYFGAETARAVYRRLAAALVPGGWLVLGPSDPAPELAAGLDCVFGPGVVLWRRPLAEVAPAAAPTRPGSAVRGPRGAPVVAARGRRAPAPARRVGGRAPPGAARGEGPAGGAPTDGAASHAALAERVAAAPLAAAGHLRLGLLALDEGAAERAMGSLRRATFLAPDNALAHFSLGRAWSRLDDAGRAQAALTHARRLLATVPDDAPVAEGLLAGDLRHAVETALGSLDRAADG